MTIKVTCACGATANVKDEYAGRTGRCSACNAVVTVGYPSPAVPDPPAPASPPRDLSQPTVDRMASAPPPGPSPRPGAAPDPLFSRDTFLLRQKHLAINEKYAVWDENGTPILFVERPAHLFRNLLALFGGLAAGGAIFTLMGFTYGAVPPSIQAGYILAGILLGITAVITVYVTLEQKRHVEFYRNESKTEKVLRVMQDRKFQMLNATFTVTDAADGLVGTFRKNYLRDLVRKHWECRDNRGELLFIAREDSIVLSLLRRLFGPMFGILRLNFIFCDPRNGDVLGEFNRSFTILDRYVLDMSRDAGNRIDRRLALAMGVMLDSGERR